MDLQRNRGSAMRGEAKGLDTTLSCKQAAIDHADKGDLIKPSEITVRSLGLRDRHYHDRVAWIWAWNANRRIFEYSESDFSAFSQSNETFDALALHGDDPRRLLKIIRQARQVLPGKVIVVICSTVSSTLIAQYLSAGADDVFSLVMPCAEAAARLRAHVLRRNTDKKKDFRPEGALSIEPLRDDLRFTPFEKKLLFQLEKNEKRITHYWTLLHSIERPLNRKTLMCLKASISKLRKKLPYRYIVKNINGEGYVLKCEI